MSENETEISIPGSEWQKCLICNLPLGTEEITLRRSWHFNCEKCHFCLEPMPNYAQIEKCLKSDRPVSHDTCYKTRLFQDFKEREVPITRSHIEALNEQINGFYPAVNPDAGDIDILYSLLMSLQTCAANVSYALGLTKEKLKIANIQEFDHQQKEKRKAERAVALQSEAEKISKQAKSDSLKAERENPALRDRRKAVEGYMKVMNCTREQAEAFVTNLQTPKTQITE